MDRAPMHPFEDTRDLPLMEQAGDTIVLFHPHVPASAADEVGAALASRWIGQGPKVDRFERQFAEQLGIPYPAVAVGAGTDALHLAYLLAGLEPGDEVIAPVFTCTATNIPLLYIGVDLRFADVQPDTMNIDPDHVRRLVTDKTRAIVCVHYGGLPCDMDELRQVADSAGVPIIEDAAHAVGATYHGRPIGAISEFTCFSFQAVKPLTTGDGGMLIVKDSELAEKARRLRWFGIDRSAKHRGTWENDIIEVGYKYQMNDIAAAIGLAGLRELDTTLAHRRGLLAEYEAGLQGIDGLKLLGGGFTDREHAAWLCTVAVEKRRELELKLRDCKIESGQVHYRNDRYQIFARFRRDDTPAMDGVEDQYLVLPLHTRMTVEDVHRVCNVIRQGW